MYLCTYVFMYLFISVPKYLRAYLLNLASKLAGWLELSVCLPVSAVLPLWSDLSRAQNLRASCNGPIKPN